MRRSEVAQLDLRLEPSDLSALRHPQIQRPLLLALVCGAMFGLWVVREIEADRQRLAQTQAPLKAELASLQSTQREHDLQLKALQELQTQWQQHQQHQDRWRWVGQALQTLGHSGASFSARLTQFRFDPQGLTLSGRIAPSQLQPWLYRFTSQVPGLGSWSSMEIGREGSDQAHESAEFESSTRFMIRFGLEAVPPPAAP